MMFRPPGNQDCHIVLRGGRRGPNYTPAHLAAVEALLTQAGLSRAIVVDCNHDNSGRQPERQPEVVAEMVRLILAGNRSRVGVMIESNLYGGCQPLRPPPGQLRYGVSVTDGCIDWATTERCLRATHAALAPRFTAVSAREPAVL